MDLEKRVARLESDNCHLKVVACVALLSVVGLLLVQFGGSTSPVLAQDAKQPAPNPGELKVTKLILVDSKGKDRVALAADESAAGPNAPVFSVLDMKGNVLARIGDTNDADEGVECQALRTEDKKLYTLIGDLHGFKVGDTVYVLGTTVDISVCMQGITIAVEWISKDPPKAKPA
jgi:hypothetical protein